jgi:hypothetical protein
MNQSDLSRQRKKECFRSCTLAVRQVSLIPSSSIYDSLLFSLHHHSSRPLVTDFVGASSVPHHRLPFERRSQFLLSHPPSFTCNSTPYPSTRMRTGILTSRCLQTPIDQLQFYHDLFSTSMHIEKREVCLTYHHLRT